MKISQYQIEGASLMRSLILDIRRVWLQETALRTIQTWGLDLSLVRINEDNSVIIIQAITTNNVYIRIFEIWTVIS